MTAQGNDTDLRDVMRAWKFLRPGLDVRSMRLETLRMAN